MLVPMRAQKPPTSVRSSGAAFLQDYFDTTTVNGADVVAPDWFRNSTV